MSTKATRRPQPATKPVAAGPVPATSPAAARSLATLQSALGNQAIQRLLRAKEAAADGGSGPRVHEGGAAEDLLRATGRAGAALGQDVLLSPRLGGSARERVLGHELRHVAQVGGRETNPGEPIRISSGDRFEQNAARSSERVVTGASPQVMRFYGDEDEVCTADDPTSSTFDPSASSVDPEVAADDTNACHAEEPICEAEPEPGGPSFDPNAIDVAGMRSDDLNTESLRVDDWFAAHSDTTEIDHDAYVTLRARLKNERTARVQNGHLWLTTATREAPDTFYMLQPGEDRTVVISVYPDLVLGVPSQSFPGPIMTVRQFEDHMSGMGIPIYTPEEYQRLLEEEQAQRSGTGGNLFGTWGTDEAEELMRLQAYVGGLPLTDTRASLIQQALPYRNANVRGGDISEAFGMSAGWRSLLATNYNSGGRGWSGDFLRPLRPLRGADPIADLRVLYGSQFNDLSLKVALPGTAAAASPSARTRFANYLKGHKDLLDTSATKFQTFASTHRPGVPLADVSAGIGLAIPMDHVTGYQALIADPTGFDLTGTGATSPTPNHQQAPLKAVYERTSFPAPVNLPDGGAPLANGADLYAALAAGRITQADFDTHIRTLGTAAAARVVAIPGFHSGTITWYESYLNSLPTTNANDIRAGIDVNTVQVLEEIRTRQQLGNPNAPYVPTTGRAESTRVALRNAPYGGLARAGFSAAGDLIFNDTADLSDPAYRAQLYELMAVQGTAGFISEGAESYARSQAGLTIARQGLSSTAPKAIALRLGARAVPGVVDAGVEIFGMATDDRDNSTEEIVVRTGRAAVIGGGSAYAGAAIGTAIGGPVGFVVGLGVGAAVGWLGNKLMPGGADYWEQQARIEKKLEEIERKLEELERRLEEERKRRERLDTSLDSEAASVAGVESIFGLPTTNPLFTSSQADISPTVGELEAEYLIAMLGLPGGKR